MCGLRYHSRQTGFRLPATGSWFPPMRSEVFLSCHQPARLLPAGFWFRSRTCGILHAADRSSQYNEGFRLTATLVIEDEAPDSNLQHPGAWNLELSRSLD